MKGMKAASGVHVNSLIFPASFSGRRGAVSRRPAPASSPFYRPLAVAARRAPQISGYVAIDWPRYCGRKP